MDNLIILDSERRNFPSSNKLIGWLYEYLEDLHLKTTYKFFIIPKIKKYVKQGNVKIIATDKETELILKENGIPFSCISEYVKESDREGYDKRAIEFIRILPNLFPEIDINYNGLSLWKADESDIYEAFFQPIINNIECINRMIAVEKAKRLIILNSSSKIGRIQKSYNIKVKIKDITDPISKLKYLLFKIFMPFAIRTIHSDFIKKIKFTEYKPKKINEILFFASERGLSYSYSFLKKFKENLTILQDEEYKEKRGGFYFDSIKDYINKTSKKRLMLFKKTLSDHLFNLKKSDKFKKGFGYKKIQLYSILEDLLEYLFTVGYLKSAFYYECFNNLYKRGMPKLTIIMCEGPKSQKVNLHILKKHRIKSLFIIHGVVGKRDRYDNLLSDKIVVYGRYYKKILIGLNNNKEKIVVTGNPAWDNIKEVKLSKDDLYSKLKLPDKKIILLATTHIPLDVKNRLAYSTIKTMIKLPQYHLIIKLHPEEKPDFYKDLLSKFKLNATIVEDLSLLHPLIKYSELVIIADSTVGLETALLDKPLIDVNLTATPYWNDYVSEKIALSVRKEAQLLPAIKSILENENVRNELKKNRKKYVYEHAYKQDGKASERVVKLIESMIKSK